MTKALSEDQIAEALWVAGVWTRGPRTRDDDLLARVGDIILAGFGRLEKLELLAEEVARVVKFLTDDPENADPRHLSEAEAREFLIASNSDQGVSPAQTRRVVEYVKKLELDIIVARNDLSDALVTLGGGDHG